MPGIINMLGFRYVIYCTTINKLLEHMNTEQIKEQINLVDQQLFELDEIISSSDEIDIHRYYELESMLVSKKRKLLTDYENLIVL